MTAEETGLMVEEEKSSVIKILVDDIIFTYTKDRNATILLESS
jgi:hypothetical protein